MLLNEIIQTDIKDVNIPNKAFSGKRGETKDLMGSGRYSIVRKDPKDPHMVSKRQKIDTSGENYHQKDLYPEFVKALVNSDQKMNPYFPRIYGVNKYTDKQGVTLHKFNMEQLNSMHTISKEELQHVLDLIIDEGIQRAWGIDTDMMLAYFLSEAIKKSSVRKLVKDRNLYNALVFLSKFLKKNWHLDLHADNMMFRRTPYGPQLVITDPFSQMSAYGQSQEDSNVPMWV
jgi:hypothetical protein